MEKVFCRSPYNYSFDVVSKETGLFCPEESLAVQAAAEECDINTIVRRFGLTGELPAAAESPGFYGDFTGATDFMGAMLAVRKAEERFAALPASMRARFGNDPGQLLEFLDSRENLEEARKLGLLKKLEEPASQAPSVVPTEK